jgi:hypothetical protein
VPAVLILRAFIETTDKEMYESLVQGNSANTFLTDRYTAAQLSAVAVAVAAADRSRLALCCAVAVAVAMAVQR